MWQVSIPYSHEEDILVKKTTRNRQNLQFINKAFIAKIMGRLGTSYLRARRGGKNIKRYAAETETACFG